MEVVVEVSPSDVDGLIVTDWVTKEALEFPAYVEPGLVHFHASAPGFADATTQLDAEPGRIFTWQLELQEASKGSTVRKGTTTTSERGRAPNDDTPKTTRHAGVVFGVGGLVTAGLAVGSVLQFREGQRKFEELAALNLVRGSCSEADNRDCRTATRLNRDIEQAEVLGWSLAGSAVLAACASIVIWLAWETEVPLEISFTHDESWVRWGYAF